MKILVASDDTAEVVDAVLGELRRRGHDVQPRGAAAGEPARWADVARSVAREVSAGAADQAVLFCWTGTGVSIAANKVPGVRAALCPDAETARGARAWNDANVLCLSLQSTPAGRALEILDAWLAAAPDGTEADQIALLDS